MPKYDVDVKIPDVDVKTKTVTAKVPDIDVGTQTITAKVPDIDAKTKRIDVEVPTANRAADVRGRQTTAWTIDPCRVAPIQPEAVNACSLRRS